MYSCLDHLTGVFDSTGLGPWKLHLKQTPKLPFYLPREPALESACLLLPLSAALFSQVVCVRTQERLPSFQQHSGTVTLRLVQMLLLLSCTQLFATPWTAARQASLSVTNSQSLLKLMCIELVMPSNHLILCHPEFLLLADYSETL